MTKVETIRMAEQAGFVIDKESKQFQPNCISATHHVIDEQLTRFEALVRADEREACAMEADYEAARWAYSPEAREPCEEVAKAIRARGEK